KPQHTPLQDSNDNFLANIQKDGTYSVIPRSAGGEITPEGLVAVGRIAREFNLYTKIKPQHTPLQDSNDNFLANIQKDGTYSVIPRSAG
ncbi:hypothetical protein, partial [Enterobacter hormaechei]|uniref:hypothetical protein n=1 Tax=Enterobacter hormaechei TaxID=158836 RepID=UPI00197ABD88